MLLMFVYALMANISANAFADNIELRDAWLRATPLGATNSAIYGELVNSTAGEEVLLSISSDVAKYVMLHRTSSEQQVMRMIHVEKLVVAPKSRVVLSPGGLHLMLTGLRRSLVEGDRVVVQLHFRSGIEIDAVAKVGSIAQLSTPED